MTMPASASGESGASDRDSKEGKHDRDGVLHLSRGEEAVGP